MSTTVGMPVVIDGPLPQPPPYSLLSVAQIIDDSDPHWMMGGQVYGYPPDVPSTFDPCSTGTFREKEEGEAPPLPLFGPFTAYLPITCTSRGINPATFADRARLAFQAVESYAVELELSQGIANPLRPFLADGNADVLVGGAAVAPGVGLSYLENAIGETGKAGLIHATPAVGAAWTTTAGGNGIETRGGRAVTTGNGTPVAVGGGYIGATPEGEAAAGAGQSWVYATGPVQVRRSDVIVVPGSLSEALDRGQNIVTYRAERHYLVDWDTQLQAAVLIDWSP